MGWYGFPLWGKLSPQVTDEGESAGHIPLIRRVPRHLPPKGKALPRGNKMLAPTTEPANCVNRTIPRRGGVTPPYGAIKNITR